FIGSYKATIGVDFVTKEIAHPDGQSTTLQIWDTAGQERFAGLGTAYYRGADACLLVYDVSNYLTFEHLDRWRRDFLAKAAPPDPDTFPFVVVGNKIDLLERVVSRRQACDFAARCTSDAERHPVPCIEASAKEGTNVDEVFREIVR
ncbi:P-loop containing nucleoside triphosphate hydrolase protein, partial [Syncephalis pseudoplumigaleata]